VNLVEEAGMRTLAKNIEAQIKLGDHGVEEYCRISAEAILDGEDRWFEYVWTKEKVVEVTIGIFRRKRDNPIKIQLPIAQALELTTQLTLSVRKFENDNETG
jgi:hypothetical protein